MEIAPETLAGLTQGDAGIRDRLFGELYGHLGKMARRLLGGRQRTTIDTGALVHELYLKLRLPSSVQDNASFIALSAKAMRHVLIDHVRERQAEKRGGGWLQVTLATHDAGVGETRTDPVDLLALEQGLKELERMDPGLAVLVECRYFAGMDDAEIAAMRGASKRTVQREWRRARAFLQAHLSEPAA